MLITIITVPLTLNYLGNQRFAVWTILSSIASLLAFADLGIGNSLINLIAKADADNDRATAQRYVSSSFFTLSFLALLLGIGFAIFYPIVPWSQLYNVTDELAASEAGPATAVFIFCFLLNLPLGIIQKVWMGRQELHIDNIWMILGKILSVLTLLLAISLQTSLSGLVIALTGVPLLTTALSGVYLFVFRHPWLKPSLNGFQKERAQKLIRIGFLFFVLQLAGTLASSIDTFVIAQVISADAVTAYSIPAQIYRIVNAFWGVILLALWPAFSDAFARKDTEWIEAAFQRTFRLVLFGNLLISVATVLFGKSLINIWLGYEFIVSSNLLITLSIWSIVMNLCVLCSVLLNAANIIKFQIFCAVTMAISNVILSIFLTSHLGIYGVVLGSIISYIVFVVIPYSFFLPRLFRSFRMNISVYAISQVDAST
jgi:O-antigen/teichoic acid export membrane protein